MADPAGPGSGDEVHPAAASAAPPARLRPGRVWYWVALLVFLAGVAWLVLGLVLLNGRIDSFQRVALPGSGEVSLDHSGGYVIYYEGPGAAEGNVPAFNVTVTPAAAPAAVQSLNAYSGDVTYSFGSREGRAVLTLEIAEPGRFQIEATDAPAGDSSLAVGSTIAGGILRIVLPSLVAMLAAVGGAITIAIVRHSRAKRASDVTHAVERLARGDQISEDATPVQASAPGPWGKRPMWPWIAGAVVVVLVVIGVFALTNDDKGQSASTTTETPTPTTMETPTTAPVEQPTAEQTQPVTLALGDSATITADGTDAGVINVKSLKITTRPYDKLIGSKPEEGSFLIFTVSLKANTDFDVLEDDFYVKTGKGEHIEEGGGSSLGAVDLDDLLGYVELNAGEHQTGLLVFDAPAKHGILAYAPNAKGNPIVTWKF